MTTLFVDDDAAPGGDGLAWETAFDSLQSALSAAVEGDEIWVAAGTYKPTEDSDRSISFDLKESVRLYGGFAGNESQLADRDWNANITILSGDIGAVGDPADNSFHIIQCRDLTAASVLDGFTVTGGNADGTLHHRGGGGIYNENSSPTLSNLIVTGNFAVFGGGIFNSDGSSPTLTFVEISDNSAVPAGGTSAFGGGIYSTDSSLTLKNVTISGNSASFRSGSVAAGGGMYNVNSTATLNDVLINNNSADYEVSGDIAAGGGVYNDNSSLTLTDVAVTGNHAVRGGGIYNADGSSLILTNTSVAGNLAGEFPLQSGSGGGIYNSEASAVLTNVIIFGNGADGSSGGGIANRNGTMTLTNVVVRNNSVIDFGSGGGISTVGNMTLTNVTVSGNSAGIFGNGGGIFGGPLTMTNSIVWGNRGGLNGNEFLTGESSSVTYSIIAGGWTGLGNLDVDPLFVDAAAGDFRLRPNSPAIDAGNNFAVPVDVMDLDDDGLTDEPTPLDFDGLPRFFDVSTAADRGNGSAPIVDIGAFESQFVNSPPVASDHSLAADEDASLTIVLPATDSDADPLTFILLSTPAHGVFTDFNAQTGTIEYRPAADYHGQDSFTFKVTDGTAESNVATVSITLSAVRDAVDDEATTAEDVPATIDVLANDEFEDAAAFVSAVGRAAHGTVSINPNGSVTYTPDGDFVGTDSFTYTVTTHVAGSRNTETARVNVTVTSEPDIADDAVETSEDAARVIDLLANDDFEDSAAFVSAATDGVHGTVVINADGRTVTYTPAADFVGMDSFTYTVTTDVLGSTNTEAASVTVTVTPDDDAVDDFLQTSEDVAAAIDVLANDHFEDPAAHISAVTNGNHGIVTIDPDGTLLYTPTPDFVGTDSFSYTVTTDVAGSTNTETASVSVTVTAEADIHDDAVQTDQSRAVTIDVLVNDQFEDPAARVSAVTQPAHGTVSLNPDGTVTYTPQPGFVGTDNFTYTVITDVAGITNTETAGVSVVVVALPGLGEFGENQLINSGFDVPESTVGLPTDFGDWGGDLTAIVGTQNAISPVGDQMLQFIGTAPTGAGGRTSDVVQYVDLAPFAEHMAAGQLRAHFTAQFNRVHRNDQTDTEFVIVLAAHAGTPENSPGQATSLAVKEVSLISDSDPATWQSVRVSLAVPADADFLQVTIAAIENVFDNQQGVELDGHYADEVSLTLSLNGDFDLDGAYTAADIDALSATIRAGQYDPRMDLDGNGKLEQEDRRIWIEDIARTTYGDANLDGRFTTSDLVQILAAGEYVDEIFGNSGWAEGDFGGDGDFDTDDLVLALQAGAYERGL